MARSAEECEMELHHRHSDLETFGDLMMFDSPVAYIPIVVFVFPDLSGHAGLVQLRKPRDGANKEN